MGAAVDCEAIGPGFLAQPVNAITSLALAVAGIVVLVRARNRLVGIGLIATGLGSFLFHGPLAPGGRWVHDVTLAWLILVVLIEALERPAGVATVGAAGFGIAFAVLPGSALPVTAATTVIAIGALIVTDRSRSTLSALALLAGVAVLGRLGATGGPLCDPDSLLQTHGVWHLGAAIAVAWWATARDSSEPPSDDVHHMRGTR